jgi:hypothetical protein
MAGLTIDWIRERVEHREYLITLHAHQECQDESIDLREIEEALLTGLVIEDYPEDKRGHSCLVYGRASGRDLHVVCGRSTTDWLVVITAYVPRPPKWVTSTLRRPKL